MVNPRKIFCPEDPTRRIQYAFEFYHTDDNTVCKPRKGLESVEYIRNYAGTSAVNWLKTHTFVRWDDGSAVCSCGWYSTDFD